MAWLPLHNAISSSEYGDSFGAQQALDAASMDTVLCTHPDDLAPRFAADFGDDGAAVTIIDVFGDLRVQGSDASPYLLDGIWVQLKDRSGKTLWRSHQATTQMGAPHIVFHVPLRLWAYSFSVHREATAFRQRSYLCSSLIRVHGLNAGKVVLLCRHGQADHNIGARYDASVGPALTHAGRQQAMMLSHALSGLPAPQIFVVSPQLRALETAFIARSADRGLENLPIEIDREAYELGFHEVGCEIPALTPLGARFEKDKALVTAIAEAAPSNTWIAKESPELLAQRATRLLNRLRECRERVLLLVAHGGIIQELRSVLDPQQEIPHAAKLSGRFCQGNAEVVPLVLQ